MVAFAFSLAIVIIQLIIWILWLLTSDPHTRYDWEFHTKKEIFIYLGMCFIPLLPLVYILYKKILTFK